LPVSGRPRRSSVWLTSGFALALVAAGLWCIQPSRAAGTPTIALIPQTTGAMLWEVEHYGAIAAADRLKCHLYWNAPTSESDMAGQVSLIDKVGRGRYQGLVLAPNHTLGIRAPLSRALAAGLPVVIVSAELDLPASNKLGYIVNDDEKMGELAATELARLIHGKGDIALIGLARFAPGITRRVRAAERLLANRFPDIHVVGRGIGAYSISRVEAFANSALDSNPGLRAVLSFTAVSTRGVHSVLKARSLQRVVTLVGCEQDSDLIGYLGNGEIAALVAENTYRMGFEAVGLISDSWAGRPIPARSIVPPLLITKQNLNSPEAAIFMSFPK
jgi:ribose transport system substrate-binding protein